MLKHSMNQMYSAPDLVFWEVPSQLRCLFILNWSSLGPNFCRGCLKPGTDILGVRRSFLFVVLVFLISLTLCVTLGLTFSADFDRRLALLFLGHSATSAFLGMFTCKEFEETENYSSYREL